MSRINGLPVNFALSEEAIAAIRELRTFCASHYPKGIGVPVIGWSIVTLNSGTQSERPIVSFYDLKQTEEVRDGIEQVSGLDIVYFITPEHYPLFQGKVLDHSPEQHFYLRDPLPSEA